MLADYLGKWFGKMVIVLSTGRSCLIQETVNHLDDLVASIFDHPMTCVFDPVDLGKWEDIDESLEASGGEAPVTHSPNQLHWSRGQVP